MRIFGVHEPQTVAQLTDVASRAVRVALMADGHVGFDIACGNAAIRTNVSVEQLGRLEPLADEIAATISFGIGRKNRANDAPTNDPLFDDDAWDAAPPKERRALREKARSQLGTVASGFLALAQGKSWRERAPEREALLDLTAPIGHDYWTLMNLTGRYAYAGREWVARKVSI
jgi:tRNA-splicing ligase RtcB (3'-phosphate/5'-hydroxy nucleic acid ligase)